MTVPEADNNGLQGTRCPTCSSRLAPDQRYCMECGARRGALPHHVAEVLGVAFEQGHPVESASGESADPAAAPGDESGHPAESAGDESGDPAESAGDESGDPADPTPTHAGTSLFGPGMPGPRGAALAVLGLLAFGVLVGSFAPLPGSIQSLVRAPLVILLPKSLTNNSSPASSSAAGGGSSAAAAASSRQIVVTQTVGGGGTSAPSQSAASGSSGLGGGFGQVGTNNNPGSSGGSGFNGYPPIPHLFLIMMGEQGYNQTFGPASRNTYFKKTLARQGDLVVNDYAVAGGPLANEIALISGQGATEQTVTSCPRYTKITPGTKGAKQQIMGEGCVYPAATKTVAAQFVAAHDTWKAYVEGIGHGKGMAAACSHPSVGANDATRPTPKHPYATWTNPFVYFTSLTGTGCNQRDVGLAQMKKDLASASTTPTFSYIAPSPCDDGSDSPCAPHAAAGLGPAQRFLESVVPEIKASPAYKAGGMIMITFAQAPQSGSHADPSSCCNEPAFPNLPAPSPSTSSTTTTSTTTSTTPGLGLGGSLTSPTGGGGHVGMLMISSWLKPGSQDLLNYYNDFSLLYSIETVSGLTGRLGYAADQSLQPISVGDFAGKGPS